MTRKFRRSSHTLAAVLLIAVTGCGTAETNSVSTKDVSSDAKSVTDNSQRFAVPVGPDLPRGSKVTVTGNDSELVYHYSVAGVGEFSVSAKRGEKRVSAPAGLERLPAEARRRIGSERDQQADRVQGRALMLTRGEINGLSDGNVDDRVAPQSITTSGVTFTASITGDLSSNVNRTINVTAPDSKASTHMPTFSGPVLNARGAPNAAFAQVALGAGVVEGQESLLAFITDVGFSSLLVGDSCGQGEEQTAVEEKALPETDEVLIVIRTPIRERFFVTAVPPEGGDGAPTCSAFDQEQAMPSSVL